MTAEDYIHYEARKHTKAQTDPLDAILDHIRKIHSHTPTRPLITIIMTVKVNMVNTGLKTIHKAADRNK